MNRFFDFSTGQLKFLAVMTGLAVLMGGWLLVKAVGTPHRDTPPFEVFLGENEQVFTGLFVLDPNTAPADSLELIPWIGPALADRIVEYRRKQRFVQEIDITDVRGIGPRTFEKIRPYLRIKR